jgi:tellurite resistance protein TehA-like permease
MVRKHYPRDCCCPKRQTLTLHRPWFDVTMSTGALAVVLAVTPNRFPGPDTIGKIFFILDLVLFVAIAATMIARFVMTEASFSSSLHHPVEGFFVGAFWVSISLILDCVQLYGVPSSGPWLVKALEILFWIYCAFALVVAIFQYYALFHKKILDVADAMPGRILPIYPLLVVGFMAGDMIPSQPHEAAYPMWVGAVMLQGLAWSVALIMYSIYTQRLMTSELPSPPTRPGMYVSVSPAGKWTCTLVVLMMALAY